MLQFNSLWVLAGPLKLPLIAAVSSGLEELTSGT